MNQAQRRILGGGFFAGVAQFQFRLDQNRAQNVVQIVRDAGGEFADGDHFV